MPPTLPPRGEEILPLVEEQVHISKRVVTSRVRVTTVTDQREHIIPQELMTETIRTERVVIDRVLEPGEPIPQTRTEGDVTIVPVFEEVVVVETKLAVKAGIPRTNIRIIPENDTAGTAGGSPSYAGQTGVRPSSEYTHYDVQRDEKGFWASLGDLFMPDDDRASYTEALHRGSIMVSATVEASQAAIAEDILDDEGTINLDERTQAWRSEGWTGHSGATSAATAASRTTLAEDGVIPIVKEELRVGKRQVESGRVRVRSYVVETPVQEQVSLREESVHIERRPVNRATTATDGNLFQDRTIEATEHDERAVVSKEARVTEELVVKKDVEQRTETISDKVRHTEVKIDDERTQGGVGKTATTSTPKR